jgi:hypothetical protein
MAKKTKPAAMYAAITGKPMPKQTKNDKTLKKAVGKKGKC